MARDQTKKKSNKKEKEKVEAPWCIERKKCAKIVDALEHFEWLRHSASVLVARRQRNAEERIKREKAKEKLEEHLEFLRPSASVLVARRQRTAEERIKREKEKAKGKKKTASLRIDRVQEIEEIVNEAEELIVMD